MLVASASSIVMALTRLLESNVNVADATPLPSMQKYLL